MFLDSVVRLLIVFALSDLSAKVFATTSCTATKPQPSGASCGVPGVLNNFYQGYGPPGYYSYDPYGTPKIYQLGAAQQVGSVAECAELCARRIDWCQSFFFDNKSHVCQLGSVGVASAIDSDPKSTLAFYDSSCFDCGAKCPQRIGAQILDNGNFENPLLGPWTSSGASAAFAPGHDSKKAFFCHATDSNHCSLSQHSNECLNYLYRFQFDWKAVPDAGQSYDFSALFGMVDDISRLRQPTIYSPSGDKTQDWTTAYGFYQSGIVKINSLHPQEGPILSFGNGSKYYVDNFKIARYPTQLSTESGSQVIQNGGFEDGSLKPWTVSYAGGNRAGHYSLFQPGINSSTALTYVLENPNVNASPLLQQKLATEPNSTYLFSFDFASRSENWVSMNVHFDDLTYQVVVTDGTNGTYTMPFYASSKSVELQIELLGKYYLFPKRGVFLLDNFSLSKIQAA